METGVSTASLFLRKNNEEALPLLNKLGIKNTEIFLTTFFEYGEPFASVLAEAKGAINVNSLHVLNVQVEPQLFNMHPRVRKDAFDILEKITQTANKVGAKYYTFHGVARMKRAARSGVNDNFPVIIDRFRAISDFCKARNVTLCLENVEWASYNRPGFFSVLSREIPELHGVLDIKQARISEYPYEAYLTEMGEKLTHVHISDINENGKICLPGRGIFDFDTLIKRLLDIGFNGKLLVEVYTDDYGDEIELKEACSFLDELVYKYAKS